MAYLQKSDYTLRIAITHLDEILEQAASTSGLTADEVLANAEALARAEIRAYLVSKYKIAEELALNYTDTRNMLVVKWMVTCVIYSIHFTVNPRDIPETVEKNYKMMIKELEASRDSNIILEIAQKDTFYTRHLIGSNTNKFISHEFTDPNLFED